MIHLLSSLKVKKIYWVDDENARQQDLDINKLSDLLVKNISKHESFNSLGNCLGELSKALEKTALLHKSTCRKL